ncbi:hypothetical protein Tco_1422124, partial [Tanacetum coccineum]
DHPLKNMEDRGIFDTGCSGHMTGNKDHLDDFEECKGGSVTFRVSKGYITGKGRISVVFVNFGAMLHNISRDDLVDLYKIVLQNTTAYGPEEDLESAFAENLRIMFDPPQSKDTVWSLPMHIPIVNWRYYDSCNVHCLNLHNTTTIYMLAERSYPLSEEECSMMLKKKLFAQNTKVKKRLVKSIKKKAGIKA